LFSNAVIWAIHFLLDNKVEKNLGKVTQGKARPALAKSFYRDPT
jgi:hypothetical protein